MPQIGRKRGNRSNTHEYDIRVTNKNMYRVYQITASRAGAFPYNHLLSRYISQGLCYALPIVRGGSLNNQPFGGSGGGGSYHFAPALGYSCRRQSVLKRHAPPHDGSRHFSQRHKSIRVSPGGGVGGRSFRRSFNRSFGRSFGRSQRQSSERGNGNQY